MGEGAVVVVGVGGTGCAVLRLLLRMRRWTHIVLVDPDDVAPSDLSRQFFFTAADVGRPKAATLAARLAARSAARLTAIGQRVQEVFPQLSELSVFVSCVDNLAARVFLNRGLKERGRPFLLVDTGSNKFQGHVLRVREDSACLHCCIELYEGPALANACTLRGKLRTFADCLARGAHELPAPADLALLHERATALAAEAGIEPESARFTANFANGFAVNIAAVNEMVGCFAVQLLGEGPAATPNYVSIGLFAGTSAQRLELARRHDCPVCHRAEQLTAALARGSSVADLARAVPDITGSERFCLFDEEEALVFAHNTAVPAASRPVTDGERFALCEAGTGRRWLLHARLTTANEH